MDLSAINPVVLVASLMVAATPILLFKGMMLLFLIKLDVPTNDRVGVWQEVHT